MNLSAKAALQVALNEAILRRQNLRDMAEQYITRANKLNEEEIPEYDVKIRELQAELE